MNDTASKDGGPAFPYLTASERDREVTTHEGEHGMSLRDYFAAQALTAAAADELRCPTYDEASYAGTAVRAYLYADAMLKARQS